MSLEQTLERIAVALEKIEARYSGILPTAPRETKVKKETAAAPVAVVEPESNPFETDAAAETAISFDALSVLLKDHSVKLGVKPTIALIIKHGADRTTPKLNTIPEGSFKACWDEATADLLKFNKAKK